MYDIVKDISTNSISHGSIPFWSWNDRLEEGELRRQINRMHDLGMNGFFMHARGGLETEYLSDEWYDCVNACVDEAKKLGMEAWSYDENGWPSGFAGGILLEDPANHATFLTYEKRESWPEEDNVLGVYTVKDGKLCAAEKGESGELHVIFQKYDASYVDTLDAEITKKFIAATHEEYRKRVGFSENMPGFFTDEPQYYRWGTPWSNKMPAEFEAAYGYSVFSGLPALFIEYEGADQFRYDYFKLCHRLFINNFIKVIYDWCEENGCKLTGHAVEESFLAGQMWCCGGVMPFYEYEHIPGIDYLGRGIASDLAPKQIGSACAQLGKKKVLSEMFACCGWDVTPTELKKIAELQYVGGVNLMCQHLYSYSERGQRKRDYPAHYSEHLPWQDAMVDFNRYYNNLGYTLSLGEEYVNTLVIHPIHSAYMKYQRPRDGASIADLEKKTGELSFLLSQNQIPFHWGDETMMAKMGSVNGDKIKVGLCEYEYVVIPYSYTLDETTVALLREYIANGGKVWIFDEAPACIEGRPADMSWLKANVTFEDIKSAAPVKLFLDGKNVPFLRCQIRNTENGRIVFITNISDNRAKDVEVKLRGFKGVYQLDMDSLEKKAVRGKPCVKCGGTIAHLDFTAAQSYVLVESDELALAEDISVPEPEYIPLGGAWKLSGRPQNMMNLDYVRFSYNGVDFEPSQPFVAIKDRLLSERYKGMIWLKFEFDVKTMPETLYTAVEPLAYTSFDVNGNEVQLTDRWWYDRSFKTVDILPYVKPGKNEITLSLDYFQRDYVYYVLYGGVSESLRNCLNFDTEIENIYLFGSFGVETDKSRFVYGERYSVCYDGGFALTAPKDEVDVRDIVTDGYPFFGGRISFETTYNYVKGGASALRLTGRYSIAEISVNGKAAGTLMFTDTIDLADLLAEGENVIGVTLYNSNRNLMGPHHRHDPEPYGVGPGTFSYEKEWHDGQCRGFIPRYAFVRFGLDI